MLDMFTGLSFAFGLALFLSIAFVLAYEFINGFHDTANAVATVIYTKAMPPHMAVVASGIFNFLGVMIGGLGVAYAIVHLFNEEKFVIYTPEIRRAEEGADVVFCTHRAASIISDKKRANRFLTAQGISMPKLVGVGEKTSAKVFSNSEMGSGKRVIVTEGADAISEDRYNTDFIDKTL